jgi:hypothetical protein
MSCSRAAAWGAGGQHHAAEIGAPGAADRSAADIELPQAAFDRAQRLHLGAAAHRTAVGFHVAGGRFREQGAQVGTRQQHVGGAAPGAQAVAQHVEEDLRRSAFRRRVQRGQAQRTPHQLDQARRLVEAFQQFADAAIGVQLPAHPAGGGGEAGEAELVFALQALGAQQRGGQVQRRGQRQRGATKSMPPPGG